MTSNKAGEASKFEELDKDKEKFTKLMGLLWSKIYERFPSINAAFRFFDSDYVSEFPSDPQ